MILTSFDSSHSADDFKFGVQYNPVRLKLGVPLISKNMVRQDEYGSWAVYNIDKEPLGKAYHYSKAVCAYDDDKVYQEKDTKLTTFSSLGNYHVVTQTKQRTTAALQ